MAEFSKLIITNYGQELLAKMIAGTGNIDFIKISSSSTVYTESQLVTLTVLSDIKQTSLISKVTRTNNVAIKVEAALSNVELTTGYYMRTLGLYAVDPDRGEILYAATVETSGNCYMPPHNGVTVTGAYLQMITTVGNADNVSLEVDPGAYATIGDIQSLELEIADLKAFVGYTDDDIFGVEVDFKNNKFTRLAGAINRTPGSMFDRVIPWQRRRCTVTDAGINLAYYGDVGYSETGALTRDVTKGDVVFSAGTKVQVMVEQPKFYYRVVPLELDPVQGGKGYHLRKARYYVSDKPKLGFKVHPAFIKGGKEKDHIYLAAYEASIYDVSATTYLLQNEQIADFATDQLSSVAHVIPANGQTQALVRNGARVSAKNRGKGWQQACMQTISATQLLFLIEYASFDMQSKIHKGISQGGGNALLENPAITGTTSSLGNRTGFIDSLGGHSSISYRGEENFYGNVWSFVDGINIIFTEDEYEPYISDVTDRDYKDNEITGDYKATGITISRDHGYISAFGYSADYDWTFMGSETKGNTVFPVSDYQMKISSIGSTRYPTAIVGGEWMHALRNGGWCWGFNNSSGGRGRTIGARLVYYPQ